MTLPDDQPDPGARIHRAAHDPDFPEKREKAVQTILTAINAVATAQGFTAKKASWAQSGPLGTVSLHLQRSSYGFDCTVNLVWQPLDEMSKGRWADTDVIPLTDFETADASGTILYLDVWEDPKTLEAAMDLLAIQALPWLIRQLTDPDAA
jgi:hypothetical protein